MLNTPEMAKHLLQIGAEPRPRTPAESASYLRSEVDKWAKVIKAANVQAE